MSVWGLELEFLQGETASCILGGAESGTCRVCARRRVASPGFLEMIRNGVRSP